MLCTALKTVTETRRLPQPYKCHSPAVCLLQRYKSSLTCLPSATLRTFAHSPSVLQNATKLQSPTLSSMTLQTIIHLPSVSQNYTVTYCLSQYYKLPLTYCMPVTMLQNSTGPKCSSQRYKLHSFTVCLAKCNKVTITSSVFHDATNHHLPTVCLSKRYRSSPAACHSATNCLSHPQ